MRVFSRLQIYIFAMLLLITSCAVPSSQSRMFSYGDMWVPPVLAPLPPMLLTIDGLADLYLGRNVETDKYVAIELRKTGVGTLEIFIGQAKSFNQAIKSMILIKNVQIYPRTIYEDRGSFQAVYMSTTPEWNFVLNSGWGSFDVYFRTDIDVTFAQVYRFNDPHNPYLHASFWP